MTKNQSLSLLLLVATMSGCGTLPSAVEPVTVVLPDVEIVKSAPISAADASSSPDGEPAAARTLRLAAVGDVMIANTWPGPTLDDAAFADYFVDVAPLLRDVDIAFVNLEGPVGGDPADVKRCRSPQFCFAFRMDERVPKLLRDAGFTLVSVANNHQYDMGMSGKISTALLLDDVGLPFAGTLERPSATFVVAGVQIGMMAFSANRNMPDFRETDVAMQAIQALAPQVDLLIVSVHGGCEGAPCMEIADRNEEYVGEQRGNVVRFARAAIDAGADVVLGHGPHVPRATEIYRDRLIAYSLGNFATSQGININGVSGLAPLLMAEIMPDGAYVSHRVVSFRQQRNIGPRRDATNEVATVMDRLSRTWLTRSAPAAPVPAVPAGGQVP